MDKRKKKRTRVIKLEKLGKKREREKINPLFPI